MNIVKAIETIMDQDISLNDVSSTSEQSEMDRCGVVFDKEQDRLVENRDPD